MRHFIRIFVTALLRLLLSVRYRVDVVTGLPDGKGLPLVIMPKHPAFVDPVIVFAFLVRGLPVRPVVDKGQMAGLAGKIISLCDPVIVPDPSVDPDGVRTAVREASQSVASGKSILIYPAGRLLSGPFDSVKGKTGAFDIVSRNRCLPVCVETVGLWGSRFSRCGASRKGLAVKGILGWFLSLGLLFPRRDVTIRSTPCPELSGNTDKDVFDETVDGLLSATEEPGIVVPLVPWGKPAKAKARQTVKAADRETVQTVVDVLSETFGPVGPDTDLANELGIDSLTIVEIACEVEKRTGLPVGDIFGVNTPRDLANIMGEPSGFDIPDGWDEPVPIKDPSAEGPDTVTGRFVACVKESPGSPVVLDNGILLSRRKLAAVSLLVADSLEDVAENRVGLMLPAGIGATAAFMGIHGAGKTPVMVNFTTGKGPMASSMGLAGIKTVVTARQFLDKWDETLPEGTRTVLLENVLAASRLRKAMAFARTFLPSCGLGKSGDHAAILFTSGSEGVPKGVPLSHKNILANAGSVGKILALREDDRFLGMLPPFHSLGLMSTIILPTVTGVKTVYRPNPADGQDLAATGTAAGATLLCATPTFLSRMLKSGQFPQTVRQSFVGAERCPDEVFDMFREACPDGTVVEGYGVTECSPVVSANPPLSPVRGTIGKPVPGVSVKIVDDEGLGLPAGTRGRLVVRGDNVFDGYLGESRDKGFAMINGERWYDTGDLAAESERNPGFIVFLGRTKRFMKVAGEMVSLPAMEAAATAGLPRTEDNEGKPLFAIVEKDGQAVVAWAGEEPLEIDRINSAMRDKGLSALHKVNKVIPVEHIPVLGTGKTDFPGLSKMLEKE